MRFLVLTTLTVFLVGLLTAGQVLGAGEQKSDKAGSESGYQMERQGSMQQAGAAGESQQQRIAAGQLNSEQIRELQQTLQEKGADPGPVDGIMGPKTRQGIQEFQRDQGIAATGQLNEETLQALDLQEFMGVSPAFGEQEKQPDMQQREKKDEMNMQQQEKKQSM